MNEMTIRLERNGAAAVPGGQLLLGYAGNRGNYRLRIEQRGEWKGLTVCAHWHTPGASAATLVESGFLTVPAAVTAVPGTGCITFEGTDGSRTVTSADVKTLGLVGITVVLRAAMTVLIHWESRNEKKEEEEKKESAPAAKLTKAC